MRKENENTKMNEAPENKRSLRVGGFHAITGNVFKTSDENTTQ